MISARRFLIDLICFSLCASVLHQVRVFILQAMNKFVNTMNFADLSLPPGVSAITDVMRSARGLIFWSVKKTMWEDALRKTCEYDSNRDNELKLDCFLASRLKEKKKTDFSVRAAPSHELRSFELTFVFVVAVPSCCLLARRARRPPSVRR